MADPFGIRLGGVMEISHPKNDQTDSPVLSLRESRLMREKLITSNEPIPLDTPFFGITQATASRPSGQGADAHVRYQFTISDAFRRGLQR